MTYALGVLDMPSEARASALALDYLPIAGANVLQRLDNPSLVDSCGRQVALNVTTLFAGSAYGSLAYRFSLPRLGTVVAGLRYCNYGRFEGYDENEMPTGQFSAADYMIVVGWGMAIDSSFSIGANFKPVFSQYESYKALALAVDVAGSYSSRDRSLFVTLAARNIGAQVVTFDGTTERLPFELSAVCSYKLSQAPFRLFVAANELQRWNLRYADVLNPTSTTDPFTGEVTTESKGAAFFDNVGRHLAAGVELDIKSRFFLRLGYNYRQTKETQFAGAFNGSGFSFGLGVRKGRFAFDFARNNYHLSQAANYFTLVFNF